MSAKKTDATTTTKRKSAKTEERINTAAEAPAEKKSAKTAAEKKSAPKKQTTTEKAAPKKSSTAEKAAPKKSSTTEKAAPKKQTTTERAAPKKPSTAEKAAPKKQTATEKETPKKSSKKPAEPKSAEISSKTPQVMKLVEQKVDVINPTIVAGKSSIPSKLRGMEPLSRIMKREAENIFGSDVTETYNLVALVTADHAATTLRRFNACDCEICVETLSKLVEDDIPARFAKLRKGDVERNAPEVKKLKEPLQKPVTSLMIRLVMQNKKRSYHD